MSIIDRYYHSLQNYPDPSMLPIPVVSIAYRRVASWSDLRESGPAVCSTRSHLFWHEGPRISLYVRRYQTMSTLMPLFSPVRRLFCDVNTYARKTHLRARARASQSEIPGVISMECLGRLDSKKSGRVSSMSLFLGCSLHLFSSFLRRLLPRIARDVHFYVLDVGETGCSPPHLRQFESRNNDTN